MERDDEVKGTGDSYDFGARMYDPRVGRLWSVDPMFSIYPSTSPYVAFGDNSLYFIDPGGETLSISTRYVRDSPEYRRLDALRTDMKLYDPDAYDILEKSSVNIVLNEGLPKGLDASRLLGYTDLAMTGITRTEVQPLLLFSPKLRPFLDFGTGLS